MSNQEREHVENKEQVGESGGQPDLELCPFCGGKAILDQMSVDYAEQYYYRCVSCAAEGGWANGESVAKRMWNMRVESKPADRVRAPNEPSQQDGHVENEVGEVAKHAPLLDERAEFTKWCMDSYGQMSGKESPWEAWKARAELVKHAPLSQADAGFDEVTETRWQNSIYEACKKAVGPDADYLIDGGGCDSGDALDFTLTEINQAFEFLREIGEAKHAPLPQQDETRLAEFDDADHPFRKWWEKHGQFMLSGGGRRESIWAARGWIAREQLGLGKEVTGQPYLREESAWLLEDGATLPRYIMADESGLGWTDDISEALRMARRADCEALAEIVEDAWHIRQHVFPSVACAKFVGEPGGNCTRCGSIAYEHENRVMEVAKPESGNADPNPCPSCGKIDGENHAYDCPEAQE